MFFQLNFFGRLRRAPLLGPFPGEQASRRVEWHHTGCGVCSEDGVAPALPTQLLYTADLSFDN